MKNKKIAQEILEELDAIMNNELLVQYEQTKKEYNNKVKNYLRAITSILNKHYKKGSKNGTERHII